MKYFWNPQLKRSEMIKSYLINKNVLTIDLGSAGMIRFDKISLHQYLVDNMYGKVLGLDVRDSNHTDIIHNLNKIPYPLLNESVTNIVAGEVIEHLYNPYEFLNECNKILKKGGRMVLTTPSAEGVQLLMGRESPYHYYTWTLKNLKSLCESAGFKIKVATRINIYYNQNILLRGIGFCIPKLRPTLFFVLEKK